MRKPVGIITFHSAHNYGSMLQAFALQTAVELLGYQSEIIDFRPEGQSSIFAPIYKQGPIHKRIIKYLMCFPYIKAIKQKPFKFDSFIDNYLHLSDKRYGRQDSLEVIRDNYERIITGSDQVWNVRCIDYDRNYLLPFAYSDRMIAYAPSMGADPQHLFTDEELEAIIPMVRRFTYLSVREQETAEFLSRKLGRKVATNVDPTILVPSSLWNDMAGSDPIIEGEYILVYAPTFHDYIYQYANRLSHETGKKIVITQINDKRQLVICKNAVFKLDVGPVEFLNLIKHASYVCSGSFHAIVFSLVFHRDFVAINGQKDARVSSLLNYVGLVDNCLSVQEMERDVHIHHIEDFSKVDLCLEQLREQSLSWLRESITNAKTI